MDIQNSLTTGSVIRARGDAPLLSVFHHKIFCDGNEGLFLTGQMEPDRRQVVAVWKLNFATRKWKCLSDKFETSGVWTGCLSLMSENQLLVFLYAPYYLSIYHYHNDKDHMNTDAWEEIDCTGDKPLSQIRFNQASFFDKLEGLLYMVSGLMTDNYKSLKIYCLNTANWAWEKLSDGPPWDNVHIRGHFEIVVHNEILYLLGCGICMEHRSLDLCRIIAFSVNNHSWMLYETSPDPNLGIYPSDRCDFSCVLHNNAAYIYGGKMNKRNEPQQTVVVGDLWMLDLTTLQWTRISDQLPPRYGHSADVTPEGCMFVCGGYKTTRDIDKMLPQSDNVIRVWLDVPPLQEMCWEVVLGSLRETMEKFDEFDDQTLRSLKIPNQFIKRLRF